MTEPTTVPRTLRIAPPLSAEEVAFVAGFGRSAVPPHPGGRQVPTDVAPLRRVWPGQPPSWSPWVPCRAGCCLVLAPRTRAEDAAAWLRFLVSHFLKPRGRARAEAPAALTFDHVVEGRVVVRGEGLFDVRVVTVQANRVSVRSAAPAVGPRPVDPPTPARPREPGLVVDLARRRTPRPGPSRTRRSGGGRGGGGAPQSTER